MTANGLVSGGFTLSILFGGLSRNGDIEGVVGLFEDAKMGEPVVSC